jgi:transcriptional/translational regulatory protein YebC/TACO1
VYQTVINEVYGRSGVGFIVEQVTEKKERSLVQLKMLINKSGVMTLAPSGSVAFNFSKTAEILVPFDQPEGVTVSEDDLMAAVTDAGASEFNESEEKGGFVIDAEPQDVGKVREALKGLGVEFIAASRLSYRPKSLVEVNDHDREINLKMLEKIEDLDDVDRVFHNMAPGKEEE